MAGVKTGKREKRVECERDKWLDWQENLLSDIEKNQGIGNKEGGERVANKAGRMKEASRNHRQTKIVGVDTFETS